MMLFVHSIKAYRHLVLTAASALFTLAALAGPDVAPTAVIKPPTSATIAEGTSLSPLYVTVTGTTPLRYKWKKDGVFLPNDTINYIYRLSMSPADAGTYTCVVSNAAGSAESNGYVVTVTPATAPPLANTIADKTVNEGAALSLIPTYTGTNPKPTTWQWYKDGVAIPGTIGTEQSGSSPAGAYSIQNTPLSAAGNYYCVFKNSKGSSTSNTIRVTVTAAVIAPTLGLNGNPRGAELYEGDKLILSANLSGASSVKWQKNGIDVPGTNSTTYIINPIALSDSGYYACVGMNSTGGSFTTATAYVAVLPAAPPKIEVNLPDTFAVDEADVFSLGVLVRGQVAYQWQKDGVDIPSNVNSSAQSSRLGITLPVTLADSGYYSVNVSNNFGSVTSVKCKVIIIQQPITLFANLSGSYLAGTGRVRLLLKGAGADKYPNFFIDKVPVTTATDGKYYMPLSLSKGLHEIKAASADGKSEVVKMVTIK